MFWVEFAKEAAYIFDNNSGVGRSGPGIRAHASETAFQLQGFILLPGRQTMFCS